MTAWRAHAKLTLSLRVLGTRDDGYHELDALTVSVSEPHDVLIAERGDEHDDARVGLELTGPGAAGIATGADNLAVLAARAILERRAAAGDPPVALRLRLHKEIPAGAGLGGGSADAAAVLVALDDLLALATPLAELERIGAGLGSDVPFCVRGGAARMRGRGERIEPVSVPALHVLVAVPPFSIPTPAVYRAWDELGGPAATRSVAAPGDLPPLRNDLEPAAEKVEPRLASFRRQLTQAAGRDVILAGSGSAFAALYDDATDAVAARERVVDARIARCCTTGMTVAHGVIAEASER